MADEEQLYECCSVLDTVGYHWVLSRKRWCMKSFPDSSSNSTFYPWTGHGRESSIACFKLWIWTPLTRKHSLLAMRHSQEAEMYAVQQAFQATYPNVAYYTILHLYVDVHVVRIAALYGFYISDSNFGSGKYMHSGQVLHEVGYHRTNKYLMAVIPIYKMRDKISDLFTLYGIPTWLEGTFPGSSSMKRTHFPSSFLFFLSPFLSRWLYI